MAIKAVIFDFDGLIVDTEGPELIAWQEFFHKYNAEFPVEKYARLIGNTFNDTRPMQFLEEELGTKLDIDKLYEEFNPLRFGLIDEQPLCAGVLDYLKSARRMKIKIGLASSAIRDWIDHHLNKHNISDYFDCIKTREDVENPKPAPDLFTCAVECLGIEPNEAIVFEDSFNGIVSAKKAGLFAVAVPNLVTKISDFSQADLQLDSLADISLDNLIERFQ